MKEVILPAPFYSVLGCLEARAITNFFGEPGAGKTNICMLAAISCIGNGGRVAYVDTEGGFSAERLKQLCPTKWPALLEKIELLEPKSFREQGMLVRSLDKKTVDLVIVDSMVALYRLEYCESDIQSSKSDIMKANRELSKQVSVLSTLAREKGIPVIITAHMFRNWDTGKTELVGGEALKYWSKVIVSVEKTGRTSERKATIIKHRSLPENSSVKFMITQDGLKPSGFRIF